MAVWREQLEAVDNNMIGFCALDFTQNFGVPIGWIVSTLAGASIEEVLDVTP